MDVCVWFFHFFLTKILDKDEFCLLSLSKWNKKVLMDFFVVDDDVFFKDDVCIYETKLVIIIMNDFDYDFE